MCDLKVSLCIYILSRYLPVRSHKLKAMFKVKFMIKEYYSIVCFNLIL